MGLTALGRITTESLGEADRRIGVPIAAGGAVIPSLVGSFQGVLQQWHFRLVGGG
jgi:hypothetical protein